MQQALEGVRVLDLTTGQAGPLATMLLADSGADVVVAAHREQVAANPAAAAVWNRNKRVISDAGCDPERLRGLCGEADLVVVNSAERAGALAGLTPDQIVAASAHPVVLVMPPFLGDHPWAGELESNSLLSAAMGASALQSSFMGGPIDPVTPQLIYAQGIWAACAAVAALIERDRSGYGQVVTVSGVHGAMIAMPLRMVDDPAAVKGSTAVGPGGPSAMYSRYRCADGAWLFIAALTPKFRLIALSVLGLEHMLELDGVNGDVNVLAAPNAPFGIRDRIAAAFAGKTRAEWIEIFRAADCPVGPVLDRSDWLDHPQVTALGLAVTVQDDALGPVTMPGNPIRFEQTPITAFAARVRVSYDEIERSWGARPQRPDGAAPEPSGHGPLHGLRVLDLGMVLAGPYVGTLFAELGAEVIKIEIPAGDSFRDHGFVYIRGQRDLALDLSRDDGRAAFDRLVARSDVVIDNFRPGVLPRLGADRQRLVTIRPDIITLSISAFGDSGPLGGEPGFDPLLQAMSGMMAAQGGDGEPVLLTLAINDVSTAALTTLAGIIALRHRERTGAAQQATVTLAGTSTLIQGAELARFSGRTPPQQGGDDFRGPASGDRFYQTADGWLRVAATTEETRAALAALAGSDDEPGLVGFLVKRNTAELLEALSQHGIPAVESPDIRRLRNDPRFREWEIFHSISSGDGRVLGVAGRCARFSRTQASEVLVPPGVGEHTRAVLTDCGLTTPEIDALITAGSAAEGKPMTIKSLASYR